MKMIDKTGFETEAKSGLVVVNFGAPWCPDCVRIEPIMQMLEGEYEGKVKFFKMDFDSNEELKDSLGIRRIPTLLFFKDSVEVAERLVEPESKMPIKQAIDSMLA